MSGPRRAVESDAPAIATLHAARIADGFLVTLGPRFLSRLYRRAIRSTQACAIVLDDVTGLVGFVAITENTGRFYREFILKDGFGAVVTSAPALARAPKRVWETLRYGVTSEHDLPDAEILAIAVAERAVGHGHGRELMGAALDELRARGVGAARVVTVAANVPAIRMYEHAGFRRHHATEVHKGVVQEVMVWP